MSLSRSQKAFVSTLVAFVLTIVNIVSALVIPRLILSRFGSEVNGLIASITQFMGYTSLLQMGVGGVIRAALYKPLAYSDNKQISSVVKAAEIFFRKIAILCFVYVVILTIVYPLLGNSSFSYFYSAALVAIIGASTITQYLFGFTYRSLVTADQRAYVYDITQLIATILNIIFSAFLIYIGCSIHLVTASSATVFIIQPIVLRVYTVKKYHLNNHVEADNTAIKQRWAGAGYSLADFVHRKTDIFVLTIFSTLKEVSVYSVYSVITNGLNAIISMTTNPFQAALGDMLAKGEKKTLDDTMRIYIFIVHFVASILFSVALCTIISFVKLYTAGIQDANYLRFDFAVFILLAEMFYCLRQPYQSIVNAAGHFRETQKGAFIEAGINIAVSILLVQKYGVVGVAVGTLVGMVYRTIDLIIYLTKHLIAYKFWYAIKRYLISFATIGISFMLQRLSYIEVKDSFSWIVNACMLTILISAITLAINFVFYRYELSIMLTKIKHLFNWVG